MNYNFSIFYAGSWGLTALSAFFLLIFDYGVYLSPKHLSWVETGQMTVAYLFLGGYILQLIIRRDRWKYLRHNTIKYALSLGMLVEIAVVYGFHVNLTKLEIFQDLGTINFRHPQLLLFQIYILSNVIRWIVKISQYLAQYNASPAHFILISFGSAILIGAGLLLLPKATTASIRPIDALFTATSRNMRHGLNCCGYGDGFYQTGPTYHPGSDSDWGTGHYDGHRVFQSADWTAFERS